MPTCVFHPFHLPPSGDDRAVRELLGGKGKSLVDMTKLGLSVPPGFVIPTPFCRTYLDSGWSSAFDTALTEAVEELELAAGRRLGAGRAPLLVSVRSGSAVSMPGMMDTVLNVGLNDGSTAALALATGDPAFASDCRQRLAQTYRKAVGTPPPDDVRWQLRGAIEAVFRSWNSDRARSYRRIEGLADGAGTAVTVQMMVFGNRDERSATGVVFSRDPSTGAPHLYGDVLFRAQGEDVVAGTHATLGIAELSERLPMVGRQLAENVATIERHYRDLVEVEFTIESGRLWILQARTGKRSPRAGLRIAHDLAEDPTFPLTRPEAAARVGHVLSTVSFTSRGGPAPAPAMQGLAASPGIAAGLLVTRSDQAVLRAAEGKRVILARPETSPADVEGIAAAAGLLTAKGGFASHAAVVARGWGKPAVVGVAGLVVTDDGIALNGRRIANGSAISLDGATGEVFEGTIEIADAAPPEAAALRGWIETDRQTGRRDLAAAGDDDLILLLAIKGMATPASLAELAGLDRAALDTRLADLDLFVERSNAAFVKAAPSAHDRAAAIIASHAEALGPAAQTLDAFKAYNDAFKTLVTSWQMRPSGDSRIPNDHSDGAYDASILSAVRSQHAVFRAWLDSIRPARALAFYAARLDRAFHRVSSGETAFLVSPRVDSYHNVWFELHEYLIRLAGRTRRQEEEAH